MSQLTIEQILAMLEAAPAHIAGCTADLTEIQLHTAPHPGVWSANEVLAHLRSCSDVWGSCILTIIHQDTPTIRAINPRSWIKSTDYLDQTLKRSLQAFTVQRAGLLKLLNPLKPEIWLRSALITGAGKPLERSVLSYVRWMAEHERPHLEQIKRITSTMQR